MTPELSRIVPLDTIGIARRSMNITASADERVALARRFGLLALDRLEAQLDYGADGAAVLVNGRVDADLAQACAATGAPVPAIIAEPFSLRFVPPQDADTPLEEIEIALDDCDEIEHDGRAVDLGEAVAQTLGLSLDPFPRSPDADQALKAAGVLGEDETGPFAALKGLLKRG